MLSRTRPREYIRSALDTDSPAARRSWLATSNTLCEDRMQTHFSGSVNRSRALALQISRAIGLVVVGVAVASCSTKESAAAAKADPPRQQPTATPDNTPSVLATIGTEQITLADLRVRAGESLDQLDANYRRVHDKLVGATLDSLIRERLISAEMKKRGKTAEELLATELPSGLNVSEVEISSWYKDNQMRVGSRSLEQVHNQIADMLKAQRRKEAGDKLEQRLRDEAKVAVNFQPFRFTFANAGAPTLGKEGAPVTLVEFSDFQCPYCQATAPTLKQVAQKYGDKVQIVYRQFPIPSLHPYALKAAEASLCANEQGKFWDMHDNMFRDQKKLTVGDLKQTARQIGLDGKKFDNCLDTGKYVEQVQNDQKEGQRIGVSGTPAMYLNGTYVEGGSVPFATLAAQIDRELSLAKR